MDLQHLFFDSTEEFESAGLFSVDLFASSGGHSRNQCAALSFF